MWWGTKLFARSRIDSGGGRQQKRKNIHYANKAAVSREQILLKRANLLNRICIHFFLCVNIVCSSSSSCMCLLTYIYLFIFIFRLFTQRIAFPIFTNLFFIFYILWRKKISKSSWGLLCSILLFTSPTLDIMFLARCLFLSENSRGEN